MRKPSQPLLEISEANKQKLLAACEACSRIILRKWNDRRNFVTYYIGGEAYTLNKNFREFEKVIHFVKGASQPKYRNRFFRGYQIKFESERIADETGAEFEDVYEGFLLIMKGFFLS